MFLSELYYIIIWLLGLFFLIRLIQKPNLIYLFPYLIGFGFIVFILPQVFIIYETKTFKTDALNRLLLMTILCWLMCIIGWYSYKPGKGIFLKNFDVRFNEKNLSAIGIIFIGTGILFNILAYKILGDKDFSGQATGLVTIYIFLQQLLFLGTGLCLILWLKNKEKTNLFFAVIGILYGLYIGVFLGRRTQVLYTLFVLGLPLFIHLKIKPSRIIVIGFLVMSFLIIPSIGQYREILKTSKDTSQFLNRLVTEMDFAKNLHDFYSFSESIELANAGNVINYSYSNSDYKFGADYWNEIVFRFIPAQFVGRKIKEGLRIKFASRSVRQMSYRNYIPGSTITGIGDSFIQFDYFGSLFFLFLGMFMKRLWFTINETKNPFLEVLYSVLLIECLISLTHGTIWYLPGFLSAFIFLSIAKQFSKTG
jgi:hypothetical protein